MTLLSMIQDAAREVGFDAPSFIISNQDATARQMLALANREGKFLSTHHNWAVLQKEYIFPTISGQGAYDLPDDFDRLIDGTLWDRSALRAMQGPLSPQQWQVLKSGLPASSAARTNFRIKKGSTLFNKFFIDPVPSSSGINLVFEYVSSHWCSSGDGLITREQWADDGDVSLINEDIFTHGIIWRFLRAKGLDFASYISEYQTQLSQLVARDGGMPTIQLLHDHGSILNTGNLPDAGLGQ